MKKCVLFAALFLFGLCSEVQAQYYSYTPYYYAPRYYYSGPIFYDANSYLNETMYNTQRFYNLNNAGAYLNYGARNRRYIYGF